MDLIYKIQTHCYEDAKLMKLFPEIVQALYDQDVLAEDTVLTWFRKGTNPKGRYVLQTKLVLEDEQLCRKWVWSLKFWTQVLT